MVEKIKNHYQNLSKNYDDLEIENNGEITVVIKVYNSDALDSVEILFVPEFKVFVSVLASAETSWCERYGVVTEVSISITYVPA